MKKLYLFITAAFLVSCEKPLLNEEDSKPKGNLTITFEPSFRTTRAAALNLADYCNKINLMFFDLDGNKVFDKVKTQTKENDENFTTFNLTVPEGSYYIVATAHSSIKSATLKSLSMVQFTASNGEKLTDTFNYCNTIEVSGESTEATLPMNRVAAMLRLILEDESIPESVTKFKFDYSGGSANYNPSTELGCTKSTQSELRYVNQDNIYEVFTFPYMAETCNIKVTISAMDASDNILMKKVIEEASMTKNRVTQYKGVFFTEDPNSLQPYNVGFTVGGDWEGTDEYEF